MVPTHNIIINLITIFLQPTRSYIVFCLAVDFHLPQSRKNSNHGPHKQNHQSSGVKGTLINGLQYTGDERLLGTINMRLYCSAIAAFFLASSANGKHCLRKMAVITGILGRLLRWELRCHLQHVISLFLPFSLAKRSLCTNKQSLL